MSNFGKPSEIIVTKDNDGSDKTGGTISILLLFLLAGLRILRA